MPTAIASWLETAAEGLIQTAKQLPDAPATSRCRRVVAEHVKDEWCRAPAGLLNVPITDISIITRHKFGRSRRVGRRPKTPDAFPARSDAIFDLPRAGQHRECASPGERQQSTQVRSDAADIAARADSLAAAVSASRAADRRIAQWSSAAVSVAARRAPMRTCCTRRTRASARSPR
jgi:hypothetical protein